jgi:hypothetical protein
MANLGPAPTVTPEGNERLFQRTGIASLECGGIEKPKGMKAFYPDKDSKDPNFWLQEGAGYHYTYNNRPPPINDNKSEAEGEGTFFPEERSEPDEDV